MNVSSVWTESASQPAFPEFMGHAKTDVLIIGGGLAGILCAYMLRGAGVDYLLVEAKRIGEGVSKNTTAKITSQHGLIYASLTRKFGTDAAFRYYRAAESALTEYRKICADIKCDFEEKDAFVYSLGNTARIEKELAALDAIGARARYCKNLSLPFPITGAIRFSKQAQFNPKKFIAAISEKLNIFENTRVTELRGQSAITQKGRITAKKIIVATHFPFLNKHGSYFLKMYQDRSYVIAIEGGEGIHGMYIDEAKKGMSFRRYQNLTLIGGGSHRTGKMGGEWRELDEFINRYYPHAREKYRWATQDCMTLDSVPYIGQYSARTPDLYVATGFNKWGMTSSMAAAMLLRDLICQRENPYTALFSPSRSILHPQLFINAGESILNLASFSKKRCPHLGCALKWNAAEHSWDCPCHGSRFSENGRLLDNPATGNLREKS